MVSVEQGYDPRHFSLVAFGGAGPLHGNALGKLLGAWPVIIPPSPGVLCAWGDATTIPRYESAMTFIRLLGVTQIEEILEGYDMLLQQAKEVMRDSQGVPVERHIYKYQADLRYMVKLPSIANSMTLLIANSIGSSDHGPCGRRHGFIRQAWAGPHKGSLRNCPREALHLPSWLRCRGHEFTHCGRGSQNRSQDQNIGKSHITIPTNQIYCWQNKHGLRRYRVHG